jgi:F-type H+-transporting ATPase subunit a
MSSAANIFSPVTSDPNLQKSILALLVMGFLLVVGLYITKKVSESKTALIIPSKKITLFGIFDFFLEAFVNFQDSIIGVHNRKYTGFTGSVFIFLLAANFLGLVPGLPAITTTVWINVALALVVFFYFNILGVREQGFFGYLKHFGGPILWLAPFMFALEIFSTLLRILTLNLRLYWNISADHMVLEEFTKLLGWGIPAAVYFLGVFVSFMQSFVFTTLTMMYILLATQHVGGHEEHGDTGHH